MNHPLAAHIGILSYTVGGLDPPLAVSPGIRVYSNPATQIVSPLTIPVTAANPSTPIPCGDPLAATQYIDSLDWHAVCYNVSQGTRSWTQSKASALPPGMVAPIFSAAFPSCASLPMGRTIPPFMDCLCCLACRMMKQTISAPGLDDSTHPHTIPRKELSHAL